jgi:hypothetical protein
MFLVFLGDMKPPFTCGGETRQAMIKYFVRETINSNDEGVSLVVMLIREQIRKLQTAWQADANTFKCTNVNTSQPDFDSCDPDDPASYHPAGLNVQFSEIAGRDILKDITQKIWPYLQDAFAGENGNDEFYLHHPNLQTAKSWNWEVL